MEAHSDALAFAAAPPPEPPASLNLSDNSDQDEHSAAAALEAEPILDWRSIQRLRQQREATHRILQETDDELQALRALRKRARSERAEQEREALEDSQLPQLPRYRAPEPRPGAQRRERRPAQLSLDDDVVDIDEARKLRTALIGCCRRYNCSRNQKRSALFNALELYPK